MDQIGKIKIASPNGRYILSTIEDELKMSHWVYSPMITDSTGLLKIFTLGQTDWDLRGFEFNEDLVILKLCRYPDPNNLIDVRLNLKKMNGSIGTREFISLSEILKVLKSR